MIRQISFVIALLTIASAQNRAQTRIVIDHNKGVACTSEFRFKRVPSPVRNDLAAGAAVIVVDGTPDPNSADIAALVDGLLPTSDDQPRRNFFLTAGSGGGRVRIDLGRVAQIAQVNTFSWHPDTRGPQVYRLWGSQGTEAGFNPQPKANINPAACGWKAIAIVDTRTDEDDGGQFGVSITDDRGSIGSFRYLLFDLYVTEVADDFGNTFYSEIDVIGK